MEMELFVRIAELGTLKQAAESTGISTTAASRYLAGLETRLGVRLIERNTRRLYLTEAGAEFLRRCKPLLEGLADMEAEVAVEATKPRGVLRISASVTFAVEHIAPILAEYNALYPDVTIHVHTANRYQDLIENNIDVAIRTRESEPDSSIVIKRLAETRRILTAAPAYLERHGTPKDIADLTHHKLLIYTNIENGNVLTFKKGRETKTVSIRATTESNDGQVLRTASLAGLGISTQPAYITYADMLSGRLVPVLSDWDLPRMTINVAFPSRPSVTAKARTFVDFLVGYFEQMQYEKKWTSNFNFINGDIQPCGEIMGPTGSNS